MPITAEEARLRAAARARAQARPLGATQGAPDFLTSMFGSLSTSISTVASAVAPLVDSFDGAIPALQGHGAQAATPIRSAAPITPGPKAQAGPLPAYAGPGSLHSLAGGFEVPEVAAPPVLAENDEAHEREGAYACPFSQEQLDTQARRERKLRRASRSRRSSIFVAIVEESTLEDAPVLAVLDVPGLIRVPGLQSERARPSLCVPLPPQSFVIDDLQSDSRRSAL
jgi:hypothetical protein